MECRQSGPERERWEILGDAGGKKAVTKKDACAGKKERQRCAGPAKGSEADGAGGLTEEEADGSKECTQSLNRTDVEKSKRQEALRCREDPSAESDRGNLDCQREADLLDKEERVEEPWAGFVIYRSCVGFCHLASSCAGWAEWASGVVN